METVINILGAIRPEVDFSESSDFIGDGLLDSFDLVTLVSDMDKQFQISIEGVDIVPENFANLDAIAALLRKYGVKA